MTTHELKCWPEYYNDVAKGIKTVELRKDDRDPRFEVDDIIILIEHNRAPTGRSCRLQITHILGRQPKHRTWLKEGIVALSVKLLPWEDRND